MVHLLQETTTDPPQKTRSTAINPNADNIVNTITISLNQNQFDALASLAFNREEYFDKLKPLLEQGDFKGATDKWRRFDHPKRRGEEIDIFLTKV